MEDSKETKNKKAVTNVVDIFLPCAQKQSYLLWGGGNNCLLFLFGSLCSPAAKDSDI